LENETPFLAGRGMGFLVLKAKQKLSRKGGDQHEYRYEKGT
jgi:hypothetical protein